MIEKRQLFPIRLSPSETLEVWAPGITAALDAARMALPYLRQQAGTSGGALARGDEGLTYILTCLLCGATNLSDPGKSQLVALQEHQMEAYGFTSQAFQSALSVSRQMQDETRYVWVVPQAFADLLHLPQRCFMRAIRRPPKEQQAVPTTQLRPSGVVRALEYKRPIDGVVTQMVSVEDEDEHTWYGFPCGEESTSVRLAWPRSEWRLADWLE
jgi:hypothetical protein